MLSARTPLYDRALLCLRSSRQTRSATTSVSVEWDVGHVGRPSAALPAHDLAERLDRFQTRFFRGLLLARAILPLSILAVLAVEALTGEVAWHNLVVWGLIAAWTTATVPVLWDRLLWLQSRPAVLRVELFLFAALVFVGLGTRIWHLLHSFVPLVFSAVYLRERTTRLFAAALVAALWAVYVVSAFHQQGWVEARLAAAMPTAIIVASVAVMVLLRRLLRSTAAILEAEQDAAERVAESRRALLVQEALSRAVRSAAERLEPMTVELGSLRTSSTRPAAPDPNEAAFWECLEAIDRTQARLAAFAGAAQAPRQLSLLDLLQQIVDDTAVLGGRVRVDTHGLDSAVVDLDPPELEAFRRILTEGLTNARKHGAGDVDVRLAGAGVIEIANTARLVDSHGTRSGIAAMRDDAERIGIAVASRRRGGSYTLTIGFPSPGPARSTGPDGARPQADIRGLVRQRRASYERAVLVIRLMLTLVTLVLLRVESNEHRSLLLAMTVTGAVYAALNLAALVWYPAIRAACDRRPGLAAIDCAVVAAMIFAETGMASPWFTVSMVTVLLMAIRLGVRGGIGAAVAMTAAMLGGYELAEHAMSLDDRGLADQSFPFGLVLNFVIYLSVAAAGSGLAWLFNRLGDAADEYEATMEEVRAIDEEVATAAANDEARRELHASLQQYVHAALIRLDLIPPDRRADAMRSAEHSLTSMADTLADLAKELRVVPPSRMTRNA